MVHCLPFANVKVARSFFTAILTATTTFPDAERYRKAYTSLADENGYLTYRKKFLWNRLDPACAEPLMLTTMTFY